MAGGILIGIGAVVALAGMAVAGTHVAAATRQWIKDLETPPDQLARLKWEQAKSAMAAGSATWRDHPNASVRLARRPSLPRGGFRAAGYSIAAAVGSTTTPPRAEDDRRWPWISPRS
ncbi:MAG: hypothetical protein ACRDNS_22170 [Trebonia sp.]